MGKFEEKIFGLKSLHRAFAATSALIFLANILCVHVRKSDEIYASPTWCTHAKKKKKNATEVTVRARVWHLTLRSGAMIAGAGATHVLTVCSCQEGSSHEVRRFFFFFFFFVNVMHF